MIKIKGFTLAEGGKATFKNYELKRAFTLAEILITLSIIGIVAAIVIPSVVQSIQNAMYVGTFKKNYSTLSQVTNQVINANGGSVPRAFGSSMIDTMAPYLSVSKYCNTSPNQCWHTDSNWYTLLGGAHHTSYNVTNTKGLILSDGTLISTLDSDISACSYGGTLKICGFIMIDINGFKGPNRWGRDIFTFWVINQPQFAGLTPYGSIYTNISSPWTASKGCVTNLGDGTVNGAGCAGRVITENDMNY
jgi:prepilin-type N-terminal cleavage/methylation domain-containing protein